jgi:hypothetical protein
VVPTTGFVIEEVTAYCAVKAGAISADVGVVRAGGFLTAPSLAMGATKSRLSLGSPVMLVANDGRTIINVPATANIAYTAAGTINGAAATGTFFGVVLFQVNAAGTISTKLPATDQVYTSAALARAAAPTPDAGQYQLALLVIGAAANTAVTIGTTLLDAAAVASYVIDVVDGFVSVVDTPVITQGALVVQTLEPLAVRQVLRGAIVTRYTSDGSGAVTNGVVGIGYRPWPMNTEVAS